MIYPFKRDTASGLILIGVEIDTKYQLKMILDTGASNTTIDSNALYLIGYDLKDSLETVEIETANGIIKTALFNVDELSAFGRIKKNFQVQVYDFYGHGVFSDYNGLIGLDFFEGTKFCIDTNFNMISIH